MWRWCVYLALTLYPSCYPRPRRAQCTSALRVYPPKTIRSRQNWYVNSSTFSINTCRCNASLLLDYRCSCVCDCVCVCWLQQNRIKDCMVRVRNVEQGTDGAGPADSGASGAMKVNKVTLTLTLTLRDSCFHSVPLVNQPQTVCVIVADLATTHVHPVMDGVGTWFTWHCC